ncbi:hypothetical protein HMF8227_00660 [Saliniradius amylolyticus]|uniref:STAS/SEC14 domain-containing protein n=1 Tax=Saliniradius amylolyticus TaxID=2183582 RepID=A0A2S2E0K4_9ALTE|nr:hypothetical protein [Saliniradius amylolyticus]AWL11156.1 hypothetical protein HMF8227_00660 [Saliniradius amylolyticus]
MSLPFSFHTQIDEENAVLMIVASGDASPEQVIAMYDDVGQQLASLQLEKVLLNATALQLNYSPDKVLEITGKLAELFKQVSLARVINLSDFRNDLIETFAARNQLRIKSFTEPEEAIAWLNMRGTD